MCHKFKTSVFCSLHCTSWLLKCVLNSTSCSKSCPHPPGLTLGSWVEGSGDSAPEVQGCPLPKSRNQGRKTWQKQGQEGVGRPSAVLPVLGKQFCNPDPSLPPAWLRFSHHQEQDVGGDFPMVGTPSPSPGRYKANSRDQRNLDGKERGHHVLLEPRAKPEVGPPAAPGWTWTTGSAEIPSNH